MPLQARPGAGAGSVWRLPVARPENFPAKGNMEDLVRAEAAALARWLKNAGPEGTGAEGWEEVAVLAPRRKWLGALAVALRGGGFARAIARGRPRAGRGPGAGVARRAARACWPTRAMILKSSACCAKFSACPTTRFFTGGRTTWRPSPNARAAKELLEKLAQAVSGRPLRDAVAWAAEAAQLRARLAAIGVRLAALEALLDQAAPAEARGDNLAAFARALRRGPAEAAEPVAKPGEIQLLTNHKAKGLEWPVVMQFGMFHKLRGPTPEYPRWVAPTAPGTPPTCWFDGLHAQARARRGGAEETRAEFERLLYVAATRPRHTLILVDATAIWLSGEKIRRPFAGGCAGRDAGRPGAGHGGRRFRWREKKSRKPKEYP